MLIFGAATSYAPGMYRPVDDWDRIHSWLTGEAPQPLEFKDETREVRDSLSRRIYESLAILRHLVQREQPDVLITLITDNGRLYTGAQVPQLNVYLGDAIWGSTRFAEIGERAEDEIVTLPCASDLASFLESDLVEQGFDMNYSKTFRPLGQPDFGAPPSLTEMVRALRPHDNVPIVPVFMNCHVFPALSCERAYEFGKAIAATLDERRERTALLVSGGMSHDHHGSRAGWVDHPLDQWALERLKRRKGDSLKWLSELESDSARGGAAELRLWAAAAGAMESRGARAHVVDYLPAYSLATGIGTAYWQL